MANLTTSDDHIARLMAGLKKVDINLVKLDKAGMFEKVQVAEEVVKDTRALMSNVIMTLHSIKNDLNRLNTEVV